MSNRLKQLFREILDENESLSLDSETDKEKLIISLTKAFSVEDWDDLQVVTKAIFPKSKINETMRECELIVHTGLYNGGACGDEPILYEGDQL